MDSLILQKLTLIHNTEDSVLHHLENLQEVVEKIKPESTFFKLLPFIGVIVGGVLTYVGQYLLKNREVETTNNKSVSETINKLYLSITQIKFFLRQLAHAEVNSRFQVYNHYTNTEEIAKKIALEEHYLGSKLKKEINEKMAFCVSDLIAAFRQYYRLKKVSTPKETLEKLDNFSDHLITLRHHGGFDLPTQQDDVEEHNLKTSDIARKDINKLFIEYNSRTDEIKNLIATLN
jgi:hypothetical protein